MSRIDPTVKKETGYIAGWVLLLSAVMELVFLLTGHMDYTVPLGNLLDKEGMAHFYAAYNIYNLLLVLSTAGLPLALSRLVSRAADADADRHLLRRYRAELLPDGSGDRAPVLPPYRSGVPSAV